jgi:hypothetical protein
MSPKKMKSWHQRIRRAREKSEEQRNHGNEKRFIQEKNAAKIQHLHETQNQEAENKTHAVRKKRAEAAQKDFYIILNFFKKSEKNRIYLFRVGIKLRKKSLRKIRRRKIFSRMASTKRINTHTPTPSKCQAKIIYCPPLTSKSLLLKHSFLSSSSYIPPETPRNPGEITYKVYT